MEHFNITCKPFGESALLIEWPIEINENILNDIISLKIALEKKLKVSLIESVSAYNSLTLIFDHNKIEYHQLKEEVQRIHNSKKSSNAAKSKLWKVPVCYNEQFGIDLNEMASAKGISADEIIAQHSEPTYTVYFIGFLPGFLYLGGLPEALHFPRKNTPRLRIKQGAVAIGGNQTGIYPIESPGGWNILGNSPLAFFDPHVMPPSFASPCDKLQFYPIPLDHYHHIKEEVEIGRFKIECQSI